MVEEMGEERAEVMAEATVEETALLAAKSVVWMVAVSEHETEQLKVGAMAAAKA